MLICKQYKHLPPIEILHKIVIAYPVTDELVVAVYDLICNVEATEILISLKSLNYEDEIILNMAQVVYDTYGGLKHV